jgi:hypothetical protein
MRLRSSRPRWLKVKKKRTLYVCTVCCTYDLYRICMLYGMLYDTEDLKILYHIYSTAGPTPSMTLQLLFKLKNI